MSDTTDVKADALVFDETMKKKKKKVSSKDVPIEEEKKKKSSSKSKSTEEGTESVEGEKKKKKSSSSKSSSKEEAVEGEKPKKKKSSSSKDKESKEAGESTTTADDDEQFSNIDFSKKKKKSSKSKSGAEKDSKDETEEATTSTTTTSSGKKPSPYHYPDAEEEKQQQQQVQEDEEDDFDPTTAPGGITWAGTDRDYKYSELTYRIYHLIGNSELASDQKRQMKPPQVFRETTKKTVWANFAEICQTLNRKPDHVLSYVFAELGTNGSVDGNDRLIIRGRFNTSQIEIVIRHYISEYVACRNCKSPNTTLERNNRLYFLCCNACNSKRTVVVIKKGLELGKKQAKE
ncbi:eIF-3 beta [Tieghemostelium lacteum]|uniref:eIF-3 beta n=1 Tax=Tieghemostelium lacteum TaxID=361077 RepID=A0A151ZK17_TIELA|nr:eIF-3 beta [Tieghemostelium lacteum]|eukprot:KYQ94249.1 eIF-3 beta [Tieghemostelium lacteum]